MSIAAVPDEAPWRAGFRSARANLIPGLVLQLVALALVTAYYQNDATREALNRLAAWRTEVGVLFAIVSTGIFGGLLPVLYLSLLPNTREHFTWQQGATITAFWCYKGFEVDLLYRLLARFVGSGHDFSTIAVKTFIDQFVYSPLIAVPLTVVVYEWVEAHFDFDVLKADIRAGGWFYRKVLPLLISSLWVWLPTVCIIYTLPTALQLPLQNLVLCFYTLLLAHLSRRTKTRSA
ncbi:MAG: hypothetical protein ABIZ04_06625 [Opitutus sp.]